MNRKYVLTLTASERKTSVDWAQPLREVVDSPRYAQAERIRWSAIT